MAEEGRKKKEVPETGASPAVESVVRRRGRAKSHSDMCCIIVDLREQKNEIKVKGKR